MTTDPENYYEVKELIPGMTSPTHVNNLTDMAKEIFTANREVGWWSNEDLMSLVRLEDTVKYSKEGATLIACKLALCHSELSEALEGMRKGLMDEHLKDEQMLGVELADTVIRILDLSGALGIDIGNMVRAKFKYNQTRADHKKANRDAAGGKTV